MTKSRSHELTKRPTKHRRGNLVTRQHTYSVTVDWTGNRGPGTSAYGSYARDHTISAGTKPEIAGSSDPTFRGDPGRWNPEELLVAAISACHQLWYLHLCADVGIAVLSYRDQAQGTMVEDPAGGKFTRVMLRPQVTVRPNDDLELAKRLHRDAHTKCYIANSVNFPIECDPDIMAAQR
jgi:organic hydroperoxide reductase OsmC/OhrA